MLTLMLLSLLASFPLSSAAVFEYDTYAHTIVSPDVVGVGQTVVVSFRIDKTVPGGTVLGPFWSNFVVKITLPDGTTTERSGLTADATGGSWFTYTPTMQGKYYFQTVFPGQWVNSSTIQRWYRPSTSAKAELTVQAEKIAPYPEVPLPTGYWTRPINAENKGWWRVADNWLMTRYDASYPHFTCTDTFAPYTSAPNSAHVLWKKPIIFGGIVGGPYGDQTYYTGLSYEQHYDPIIINGRIIYGYHHPGSSADWFGTYCLDLYTGEEVWFLNNTRILIAQAFAYDSGNEHGIVPHLWSMTGAATNTTMEMYDAFTGRYILTVTNVTLGSTARRGAIIFGPKGEIISYALDNARSRLTMWNSSLAFERSGVINNPAITGTGIEVYSPRVGQIINGNLGIQWNVSIPRMTGAQSISQISGGYILVSNWSQTYKEDPYEQRLYPTTLQRLSNGSYPDTLNYLWTQTRNVYMAAYKFSNIDEGVYVMFDEGRLTYHGYSVQTGQEIWVSNPLPPGWSMFSGYMNHIAYGRLYTVGYDGHVRAYNVTNGRLLWDYYFGSAGYETPYGSWPVYSGFIIADGKMYLTNDDHSPDASVWRGGKLWCIDAYTGECLWNISGWMRHGAISDGIYTVLNSLDGQVYTFGKGPTTTTVNAPQVGAVKGAPVTITGSVTDQSPGQKGTPAIADEWMSAWMEYLHMQKPKPANAVGVPVKLTAIDPNGNLQNIGTATTDSNGNFGIMWTPPVEGLYKIVAAFEGTKSYAASDATAYMGVSVAPAASPVPTSTPQPTTPPPTPTTPTPTASPSTIPLPEAAPSMDTYYILAAVAAVAAIIIVAAFILRKKQ
jgi:hypothetical protein